MNQYEPYNGAPIRQQQYDLQDIGEIADVANVLPDDVEEQLSPFAELGRPKKDRYNSAIQRMMGVIPEADRSTVGDFLKPRQQTVIEKAGELLKDKSWLLPALGVIETIASKGYFPGTTAAGIQNQISTAGASRASEENLKLKEVTDALKLHDVGTKTKASEQRMAEYYRKRSIISAMPDSPEKQAMLDNLAADFASPSSLVSAKATGDRQEKGFAHQEKMAKENFDRQAQLDAMRRERELAELEKKPIPEGAATKLSLLAQGLKGADDFLDLMDSNQSPEFWQTGWLGDFSNSAASSAVRNMVEAVGRMNSGAAISETEWTNFRNLMASPKLLATVDGQKMVKEQLNNFVRRARSAGRYIAGNGIARNWETEMGVIPDAAPVGNAPAVAPAPKGVKKWK